MGLSFQTTTQHHIIRHNFILPHVVTVYKFLEGKYLEEWMVLNMKTGNEKVGRIEN